MSTVARDLQNVSMIYSLGQCWQTGQSPLLWTADTEVRDGELFVSFPGLEETMACIF